MFQWKNADPGDLKRFNAISMFLNKYPSLLTFLFSPTKPELNGSPESLKKRSGGFSSGEKVLINIALDIWSDSGDAKINDLYTLDSENFQNVLKALIRGRVG
jgi:hypothetical protein